MVFAVRSFLSSLSDRGCGARPKEPSECRSAAAAVRPGFGYDTPRLEDKFEEMPPGAIGMVRGSKRDIAAFAPRSPMSPTTSGSGSEDSRGGSCSGPVQRTDSGCRRSLLVLDRVGCLPHRRRSPPFHSSAAAPTGQPDRPPTSSSTDRRSVIRDVLDHLLQSVKWSRSAGRSWGSRTTSQ